MGALAWSLGLFALLRSPWVEQRLVLPLTQLQKQAADYYAGSPPVPITVTLECSGTDVLALCLAALLACPVPWRARLAGAAGAVALILGLNTVRIATLGHAAASSALFQALHLQVWPAILVLACAGYVFAWMRMTLREGTEEPDAGAFVLAGTDEGLFRLGRDEAVWRRLPLVRGAQETHPRVADVAALPDGVLLAATPLGVFRSGDAGLTWQRTSSEPEGPVSALATSPGDPRAAFFASPLGFWMSADAGTTWRRMAGAQGAQVNALAVLGGEPRLIFAASNDGLYRSADLGRTWTHGGWGLPHSDLTGLAVHPDGRTAYVSDFKWGGVYRTRDRGETWTRLTDTGLASDRVWTLGLDPAAPDELLAASLAGGLHFLTRRCERSAAAAPARTVRRDSSASCPGPPRSRTCAPRTAAAGRATRDAGGSTRAARPGTTA